MPKQQVLTDCHCLTMQDAKLGIIENAALVIEGAHLAWVGKQADLPLQYQDWPNQKMDGEWITPGLVDCHTHVIYGGDRANEFAWRLHGESYASIHQKGGGINATVSATRSASEAALEVQATRRIKQMMRHGTTTVEIKSGYGLDPLHEIKMLKVAKAIQKKLPLDIFPTFLGLHAIPKGSTQRQQYIEQMLDEVLPQLVDEKLIKAVDIFVENIAFQLEEAKQLFAVAKSLDLGIKVHAEQLSAMGGAALAAKMGALSADHLEYIDEQGIKAMAEAGTVAVLLPGAFYFLQETQKPPILKLRDAGVTIALATDCNPGSSPVVSLPLIMNMGCVLFNMTPEEALLGVTKHAAKALGFSDRGMLKAGYRADLALWQIASPYELCYLIGQNQAQRLMIQGEWVALDAC